jgi:hypothetical protein
LGTHRGSVQSFDTLLRFFGEVRCRFSQKIPLLLNALQLTLESSHLLISGMAFTWKRSLAALGHFFPPSTQHIGVDAKIFGN